MRPRSSRAWSSEISLSLPSPHGLERLGKRHPRPDVVVDEQAPDVLVGVFADQRLDVHAAIAQRAALAIRLHDLGLDRDDALEARLEVAAAHACISSSSISWPVPRSRAAASTSAAAARSWTATPTDLYNVVCSAELRPAAVPV